MDSAAALDPSRRRVLDDPCGASPDVLGISEADVVKDGESTVDDVSETALFFASFASNALTGQSLVVSHGWFMQ